jgi:hypothetical protein
VNDRIAYLTRADRGARVTGVRLIGPHGEDRFDVPTAGAADVVAQASDAAESAGRWLATQLTSKKARTLAMLCLDADGGMCSWIASPSRQSDVVASLARQGPSADGPAPAGETPVLFFAESAGSAQLQGLSVDPSIDASQRKAKAAGPGNYRVAVMALGDVSARLVADELDRSGVGLDSAASIWHLMAMAWDSAPATSPASDLVAAEDSPTSAVILIEPEGRLVWCWCRGGKLLTGGSMRLAIARPSTTDAEGNAVAGTPFVSMDESDVSRLCAEWLGWAAQLGAAPIRTVCVVPTEAAVVESPDGPVALGERLGKRWPGTSIDVAVHDDPVGATIRRALALEQDYVQHASDPQLSLVSLSHRPGASLRRLFRWSALAIGVAAVALAAAAFRIDSRARATRGMSDQTQDRVRALVEQVHKPALISPGGPVLALRSELASLQKQVAPAEATDPVQPILEEFEALSLVIGSPEIELTEFSVDNKVVRIVTIVPDLATAELLSDAVKSVGGSHIASWANPSFQQLSGAQGEQGKVRVTLTGQWPPPTKPGTPAPQPASPPGGGPA